MVKGKRWKKGQSSSSNPETKKYREAAKSNRIFSFGLPSSNEKSGLTQKALAELDSRTNIADNDAHSLFNDNESIDTFKSWATNWSDCTNATFNKVHRYWSSNSALHKEILAVLAAVTEIIKEKDGKESEIEYFAALMTGIESVKENEESTAAFLYLIALAIKKVPESILRVKYLQLLKTLLSPLVEFGEKASNVTLIKSGLMCLCWLLKSQDKQAWKLEETQNAYMLILSFIDHQKPKIRKCGQEAVRLILKSCNSSDSSCIEDISAFTAEYCLELIKNGNKFRQLNKDDKKKSLEESKLNSIDSQTQTILHTLALLKYIIHYFQLNTLKSVGECLLTLMTLKDILITSLCFQVFHELFESQVTNLNAELNGQIINALYDYQPSENDPQQLIGWLAVIESAARCLNRLNKQICLSHLPSIVQKFISALSSSHHKNVHVMSTNFLCNLLEQCVQTNILLFVEDIKQSTDYKKSLLSKVFTHIESGLSYQYHTSWIFVMKILACAFTSFKHRDTFIVVEKCLSSLANLRESDQFEYKKEADFAIGRAIQNYGPKLVIDCIPLQITGDEKTYDYPRSWMLPLLKENIEKTELAYFIEHLYPLAKKLKAKGDFFQHSKKMLEAKIFDNLQNQIWSLLPGFCDFCTDFKESFKNIAKTLGETLEKSKDLRYYVLHGLKNLINRNTDENKVLMGKFAKNYLPIMFNIYTTEITIENDSIRQTLVDIIKSYLQITESDLANQYLMLAINNYENYSKLCQEHKVDTKSGPVVFDFNKTTKDDTVKQQANLNVFAKHGFMDLIAILVKYANQTSISFVFEMTIQKINDKNTDKTDQKKFYKILNSILNSGKPSLNDAKNQSVHLFIESKIELIANLFATSLGKCNAAAKVPRLKCLIDLMDYVKESNQKVFLRQLLPEIILCVRELNHKSRETAFELLNTMLRLWQKLGVNATEPISEIDSLYEFFHLIMVGLAGSTNMISCTCLALSSLAHEYREHISGPLIGELIETACLLVKSDQKEIIISSLNLLKILCTVFNQATLAQYLKQICDVIHGLHEKRGSPTNTSENSFNNIAPITKSQQIRTLVKLILKKLIKKFNYQMVFEDVFACEKNSNEMGEPNKRILTAVVKQGLENLLTNIKKAIEKDKKRKEEQENSDKKSEKNLDLVSMYTSKTKQTAKYNEVEDLLKESESEEEETKDVRSQKTSKTNKSTKKERVKKDANNNPLAWIQENETDDPLDLLDPMAIKRVLATKPLTKEEIENKKLKEAKNKAKNRGFKVSNDGKILIDDDSDEDDKYDMKSSKSKSNKKKDDIEEMMDTLSLSKKSLSSKKSNKLKRDLNEMDSDDDDIIDNKSRNSYKAGGSGIHRKLDKNKKETTDYGAEYRSKKAKGDVKKKNMPDPYAYIPLNMSKLNKRKRAKLQGEYKGVVKAVKRGVQKASKFK